MLSYNLTIALIAALMLKLWAIVYNLEASMLLVTLLCLIEDQWIMFALFNKSTSTRMYLICNKRSLLFVNKELVNINSWSVFMLSLIKLNPLVKFLICYQILLLSSFVSFLLGLITQAVQDKLKEVLGWYIDIM